MSRPVGAPIRDIVFDLGGVLIDWDPRHLFCGHLGRDAEQVERFLAQVCTPAWHRRLDGGAPFDAACAPLIDAFPEFGEWIIDYVRGWPKMFAGAFGGPVETLYSLKADGFRVHALSNYPAEQIAFLYGEFPFMREFDTVVLSGLVGAQKPDPAIFGYLLERIGSGPCLFVDDRAENVAAARRCGMLGVEYAAARAAAPLAAVLNRCAGSARGAVHSSHGRD